MFFNASCKKVENTGRLLNFSGSTVVQCLKPLKILMFTLWSCCVTQCGSSIPFTGVNLAHLQG